MKNKRGAETQTLMLALALVVVVGLVFWPTLRLPFLQDDFSLLRLFQQDQVAQPVVLLSFFSVGKAIFYRPLAKACLLAMYALFGDRVWCFHLAALAIHAANAWLVGRIVFSLTRDRVIAACTALIYAAAIAIHLDTLAWVVGIYDLGGALCFLLSMQLYIERKVAWSGLVCFAGCLFKESVIVLPLILLWYELLLADHPAGWMAFLRARWRGVAWFSLLMGSIAAIKAWQLSQPVVAGAGPYRFAVDGVLDNTGLYLKWMSQSFYQFWYLGSHLSVLALLLAVVLTGTERKVGKHSRQLFFLLGWLLVGLLPVIFFAHHAYRYYATYSLPAYICLILCVAKWGAARLLEKELPGAVLVVAVCAVALVFSVGQGRQVYAEGMQEATLADGSNMLINRAAVLNTVHDALLPLAATLPPESVVFVGGVDLWGFDQGAGPVFRLGDKEVHVYSLDSLRAAGGRLFSPLLVEDEASGFAGLPGDKQGLFALEWVDGRLARVAGW